MKKNEGNKEVKDTCEDENQMGKTNWHLDDYQTPTWYIIEGTHAIKLWCPARRIMNTFDYLDVKVGIKLHYQVYGFYWLTGPDASGEINNDQAGYTDVDVPKELPCPKNATKTCKPEKPNPLNYQGIRIKILDTATRVAQVSFTVMFVGASLMLAGIYT